VTNKKPVADWDDTKGTPIDDVREAARRALRDIGLPPPPPPKAGSGKYYKAKIRKLVAWLEQQEKQATDTEKQAWEDGKVLLEMRQSGRASMAAQARYWLRENIK
jgi:hypothetical protein